MEKDRRQHSRGIAHWPVILETAQGVVTGITMDISAGGVFICCRESLRVKERSFMALHNVPFLERSLEAEVEVIRSNIHCMDDELMSYGIGVRFSRIADEDEEFITNLVSEHLEQKDINWIEERDSRKIIY
jgi:c-di-GMP-binding flagellar brake protein YcgR